MSYDINECKFSGQIIELKDIATKTKTRIASFKIQCHKEQIRAVCFKELAEQLLENFGFIRLMSTLGNVNDKAGV